MLYSTGRYGAGHTGSRTRRLAPAQRGAITTPPEETAAWLWIIKTADEISPRLRDAVVRHRQGGGTLEAALEMVAGEYDLAAWYEQQADRRTAWMI